MSIRKRIKGTKNSPFFYDEVKQRHSIFLTPSSWRWLQEEAKVNNTSPSELLEQMIRQTKG